MKIIECPRDAMQGIQPFIPTEKKVEYLNLLLKVGFDTIDFGSFVSPKAIPQLSDTAEVLENLDLDNKQSNLLAIIANQRGAENAVKFDAIDYLGYPFSISETFQQRNTNRSIQEAFENVKSIQELAVNNHKSLVIYISMGFGNPYGDEWSTDIVEYWVEKLRKEGIKIFSLSDTVGTANPNDIAYLFNHLIEDYPKLEFGAHFHARPDKWREKIEAAYQNGCRRFDSTVKGYGGCPMAEDELVGNIATENLIQYLEEKDNMPLNLDNWSTILAKANDVFNP